MGIANGEKFICYMCYETHDTAEVWTVISDEIRLVQFSLVQFSLVQIRLDQIRLDQIRLDQIGGDKGKWNAIR